MYATSSDVGDFDLLGRPLNRGRKRITGTLELGPRGLFIITEQASAGYSISKNPCYPRWVS
jgi:hypothetical protein